MEEYTFEVLKIVISISIVIVMGYVVPYLRIKLQDVVDETVWKAVVKEVKSVEQTLHLGSVKKEEVIVRVTGWANSHNIKITQDQISNLIEAAVFIMKNEKEKADE